MAAPELAALGGKRIESAGLVLVGTLRRDGWPRVSPVEAFIVDGELLLGMMWQSRKARDLLRDDRLVVHSVVANRMGTEGDFKLYGRAVDVAVAGLRERYADAVEAKIAWRPMDPFHLFRIEVTSAAFVVFGEDRFGFKWDPHRGLERWEITPP